MIRDLDPARVPSSCERCGKVELLPDNEEAWEFVCMFPGVLTANGMSPMLRVDYSAVQALAVGASAEETAGLIIRLEAIARGYNRKRDK